MFQVRIHGRGGQGVVTGADMLSIAAFIEGHYAAAFPSFGSERMGAPVISYCRIDNKEIRLREPILQPDALIVQDVTLLCPAYLCQLDILSGLKQKEGYLLVNSHKSFDELSLHSLTVNMRKDHLITVPATDISIKYVGRPVPNVPLLAGFAAASGLISLNSICKAIEEKFSGKVAENNVSAAKEAYQIVLQKKEKTHAKTM